MVEVSVTDAIVVCWSKGRECCKLIFGPDWEECYFIRPGDVRDTSCQLISSALSLLKLLPVLLLLARLLRSRMCSICYMKNQQCMGDVDCC